MENIVIARLLDETAALLEIDAADPFRIRSYRRAAEAVEQQTTQLAILATSDPKLLLAIPGYRRDHAGGIAAPRPRDCRRPRSAGHRPRVRAGCRRGCRRARCHPAADR